MTVYKAFHKPTKQTRMVESPNPARVFQHVARPQWEISPATPEETFRHAKAGGELENVNSHKTAHTTLDPMDVIPPAPALREPNPL